MSDSHNMQTKDADKTYGNQSSNEGSWQSQSIDQVSDSGNRTMSGATDMISGQWNQIKGKVKERWGELTDDDLMQAQGKFEQLVGVIQKRTGQARNTIESELRQMLEREPESQGSAYSR